MGSGGDAQPKKALMSAPSVRAIRAYRQVHVDLPTLDSADVALCTLVENICDLPATHARVQDRRRGRDLAACGGCDAPPRPSESDLMYTSRHRNSQDTGCHSKHTARLSLAPRGYVVPRRRSYRRIPGLWGLADIAGPRGSCILDFGHTRTTSWRCRALRYVDRSQQGADRWRQ